MPPSLSQSASGANRKKSFGEVSGVALVLSLLLHTVLVGATALRASAAERPDIAPSRTSGGETIETDFVEVLPSTGDTVLRGSEEKAQGDARGAEKAAASRPETSPEPATPQAPEPKPPAPPASKPVPSAPRDTRTSQTQQHPDSNERDAPLPANPTHAVDPERPSKADAKRAPASGGSDERPGHTETGRDDPSSGPPGEGGGQKRAGQRDLAATFTLELPDCAYFVEAWAALPPGEGLTLEARIELDASGKVIGVEPEEKKTAPHRAFVDTLRRVAGRLKVGRLALENGALDAGVLHVRVTARISDVPAPDRPGGAVALEHSFDKGQGHASFTLESGRRVDFTISVVKIDHAS